MGNGDQEAMRAMRDADGGYHDSFVSPEKF
jgi:hypothetical protein